MPIHANTIALYGPAGLILIALLWGFARILYLSRTQGVSVLAIFGREKTAVERWLMAIAIVLDAYLLIRPFYPAVDVTVLAGPSPVPHWGVAVMGIGIAIAVLSQIDMGAAWRIGVPKQKEASQTLVTKGLYRFSRNPIYVGIMTFLAGAAIVVPGPVTILSAIMAWPLINSIIAREETFLSGEFGQAYRDYCTRVRRWL